MYCTVLPGQVRRRDVLPPDLAEAQVLPLQLHPARSPHQHPRPVGPHYTEHRHQRIVQLQTKVRNDFGIMKKAPTSC